MRTGCIYALCDPDGTPRYIGKTVQTPGARRGEHIREATTRGRQSQVHKWTRWLLSVGATPALWVLEHGVPIDRLNQAEMSHISAFREAGFDLLNYTGGGNGALVMPVSRRRHQAKQARQQGRDPQGRFCPIPT